MEAGVAMNTLMKYESIFRREGLRVGVIGAVSPEGVLGEGSPSPKFGQGSPSPRLRREGEQRRWGKMREVMAAESESEQE